MAKLRVLPAEERKKYRSSLPQSVQDCFKAIEEVLEAPGQDLDWYFRLGTALKRWHSDAPRDRGDTWLSKALGPSRSVLQKARLFAKEYPTVADVQELKNIPTDWTKLILALPLKDKRKRHQLLKKAQDWDTHQLRFEVQRLSHSLRVGKGGRPRSNFATAYGPDASLREMQRMSQNWREIYQESWCKVKKKEWQHFLNRKWSEDSEQLQQLLQQAEADISALAKECKNVVADLAAFLKTVRKQ
jgi:hypothetical protein